MSLPGVVACGHPETAAAAEAILRDGGNAFDAIVAAHFAACVAEPVLTSLGGGGFLLAHTADGHDCVYDFFAQTPQRKRDGAALDFYPITADFGTTQQVFHIGPGSIATPGVVRGMFAVHRDLCSLPMVRLMEPAIELARRGIVVNALQAYILDVVKPIYLATPEAREVFASRADPTALLREGEVLRQSQLADTMEALAREGDALFYHGEIAQLIDAMCVSGGGHLTVADLASYQVVKRAPLELIYRDVRVLTNPPPSSGGLLIAFGLKLLEVMDLAQSGFGSIAHLETLANVMDLTNKARMDAHLDEPLHPQAERLLDAGLLRMYQQQVYQRAASLRGTTHMSVMDRLGNVAGLTVSNGEGCGHLVPDTGIMLNNMLGEEDLNPQGFNRWPAGQRMTSMMAPSLLLHPDGSSIVLGSGGSNRLRTAILQVVVNLIDFGMSLGDAVHAPRIHYEAGLLSVENGFDPDKVNQLIRLFPEHKVWAGLNLFFGGVHSVMRRNTEIIGAGDPRRGGVAITVSSAG